MRSARIRDWREALRNGVINQGEADRVAAAQEAVSKVIEVDDFAPEALSPASVRLQEHRAYAQPFTTRAAS